MSRLAVVIPVLHDTEPLRRLLGSFAGLSDVDVVIVDGGGDREIEVVVASLPHARLIRSPAGRGRQLNAGARTTAAELLFFLHADSTLPPGWYPALLGLPPTTAGGWFRFALEADVWQARLLEWLVALRVRALRLPYGDQGIFVRRELFEKLGGFQEWPLMEDVEFVRRLVKAGPVVAIPLPLRTSARRWQADGWIRRSLRNAALVTLYLAGVRPARLARWYEPR